ncbi:MAG: ABC transporter ATP-binding protein [Spirochaetaceae bacterium]|nr:MAG: ABC transporter ATP-binding protein [Spirochaetaceae bacterium]
MVGKAYQMGSETVHALRNVNLTIESGDYIAVIGPSGSGKSTLMNIVGCLDTATHGRYTLADHEVARLSGDRLAEVRNATIGFVFQTFNLLPRLSARENVELPLIYAGMSKSDRRKRSEVMLRRVGLEDRMRHKPNELSGGQRQRVAIARALATSPAVLLADEPTGALDTHTGLEIMRLLEDLNTEGTTLILVTHDHELAMRAHREIRLRDGEIVHEEIR